MRRAPLRLVTFDFWETLVTDRPENLAAQRRLRIDGLRAALVRAGLAVEPAVAEAGHDRSQAVLVERYWGRHVDLPHREQVRLVLDCIVPGAAARMPADGFEAAVAAYISPVLACPPALQPGAAEAVRALAARGVRLGIVSNTGRTPGLVLRRLLEGHGLLRHFDVVSYSDEVGHRKPLAEIFLRTLAAVGAAPAEAAHVGDDAEADVAGARGVGMRGSHFHGARPPAADADLAISRLADLPGRLAGL